MSRKNKIEPVEKVKIVERYLKREIGLSEARRLAICLLPLDTASNKRQ